MEIISREAARECGLKRYFTGKGCVHGHKAGHYVSTGRCCECQRLATSRQRAISPEKFKEYGRANRARTRDERLEGNRRWKAQNADRVRAYMEVWRAANADKVSKQKRRWTEDNRPRVRESCRRRDASKAMATPKWLTDEHRKCILSVYEDATRKTADSGDMYEVDHIVPIRGKLVCGLHVPWNLQVITKSENSRKRNTFIVH